MAGLLLYPLSAVIGLAVSAWAWERASMGGAAPTAAQKHGIFLGCLVGMAAGAKLAYFLSEGLLDARDPSHGLVERALMLLTGKSVTGALLGGYVGVEVAKRKVGHAESTGDAFALLAPFSVGIGRLGCWAQGCCLGLPMPERLWTLRDGNGVARWPAVPLELAFNVLFFSWAAFRLHRRRRGTPDGLHGQLFHFYLLSYGAFRFAHEFVRDTPRLLGAVSGYQLFALALIALGAHGYVRVRSAPFAARSR